MSDLSITTRQENGIVVMDVSGRIMIGASSALFKKKLDDLVGEGRTF